MSNVLALPYETQVRILDKVRRAELISMLLLGALLGLYYQPWGALLALPMFATAVILVPRERAIPVPTREESRSKFISNVDKEGRQLLQEYLAIRERELSDTRSQAQTRVRRQIRRWIDSTEARFAAFPEFAAIFESRNKQAGVVAELEGALEKLHELERLSFLSKKLHLPI